MKTKLSSWKIKNSIIFQFYNPIVIIPLLLVYAFFYSTDYKVLPDYFHFGEIANVRSFIWGLFTVSIGFSGLILTILLLSFNYYFKSTRRNTIEVILDNIYFKILFSGFIGIILLDILGYLTINEGNKGDKIAVFYFLWFATVTYIIIQFPLAAASIKHSTSFSKVRKITKAIEFKDIEYLVNPTIFSEHYTIEDVEKNHIIILKDIGASAIKEGDWVLPQAIFNGVVDLFRKSFDENSSIASSREYIHVILWLSNHYRRLAVKNSDPITLQVLYHNNLSLYYLISEKEGIKIEYFRRLDIAFRQIAADVIANGDFSETREFILKDYIDVMCHVIKLVDYTDDELPTDFYRYSRPGIATTHNVEHYQLWHYLTHAQMEIAEFIVKTAIKNGDEMIYDHFNWRFQNILSAVESSKLSEFQRITYLRDFLMATRNLILFAISNNIYQVTSIVENFHIVQWMEKGWRGISDSAMFGNASILTQLLKTFDNYILPLNEFVMTGRLILNNVHIDDRQKAETIDYIFDKCLKWLEIENMPGKVKLDLQHQLHWLYDIVKDDLGGFLQSDKDKIEKALIGYDYRDYLNHV